MYVEYLALISSTQLSHPLKNNTNLVRIKWDVCKVPSTMSSTQQKQNKGYHPPLSCGQSDQNTTPMYLMYEIRANELFNMPKLRDLPICITECEF